MGVRAGESGLSRPNLFTLDTWGRHENLVLEVFQCALVCLESESNLPEDEDELNRKLYFLALKENHRLLREGRGRESPIMYESRNQPTAETRKPLAREWKRPDFKCGFVDSQSKYPLFLDVECKRLGKPSSGRTVFNKLYTEEGVKRFTDPELGYGEGAASGAMIGYLQSMLSDEILKQVNRYAKKTKVPAIKREGDEWVDRGVTRLTQTLDRKVVPSPFSLGHLWIDLRRHYPNSE